MKSFLWHRKCCKKSDNAHKEGVPEMTADNQMHVKRRYRLVLSGKDKGKEGKIIEALPKKLK